MATLFDPIQLGDIHAANRVIMAPLTRARATREHIPTPIMAEYYAQRSSSGLIISEAIGISQEGLGWPYAPGIWSQQQVEAWKPVVEAVHKKRKNNSATLAYGPHGSFKCYRAATGILLTHHTVRKTTHL